MKTKIVFLLGEAGSGKDTIGKEFVKRGYTRVSFADVMKQEYADLMEINVSELHIQGPKKELHRPGLIEFAENKKKEDPLIWLKKAFAPYQDTSENFKEDLKLVVTDFRRESEVDWYYGMLKSTDVSIYLFRVSRKDIEDNDVLTHFAIGKAIGINKVLTGFINAVIFLKPGGTLLTQNDYKNLVKMAEEKVNGLFFLFNL